MSVHRMTRTTATSIEAIAKRAAELVREELPAVVARTQEVDNASSLDIKVAVKPAGRTEATKDPEISITAGPNFGKKTVTFKARMTGEGDDAQLNLISEFVQEDVTFQDDETGESGEEDQAATG